MQPADDPETTAALVNFRNKLRRSFDFERLKDIVSKRPAQSMGKTAFLPDPDPEDTEISEKPTIEDWMKPIYEDMLRKKQAQKGASQSSTFLF